MTKCKSVVAQRWGLEQGGTEDDYKWAFEEGSGMLVSIILMVMRVSPDPLSV
jgi:hypothetical protein